MAEFTITNDHSQKRIGQVMDALRRPRLFIPTLNDYPKHDLWLQHVEAQLNTGEKRAMAAFAGAAAIGVVVYQRHIVNLDVLEVRNISVSPEKGGRLFGSCLLRNAEVEGLSQDFPGVTSVMVDTKETNTAMMGFLSAQGYGLEQITDLYGTGNGLDAVFTKVLRT